jgi:cytochrome c5
MRAIAVSILLAGSALVLASGAIADESQVRLRDAPGKDLVLARCGMCHSLDYIPMNSRFLDRKGWEASVSKMIKVMGAPIPPEDAAKIVDYLASEYGKR